MNQKAEHKLPFRTQSEELKSRTHSMWQSPGFSNNTKWSDYLRAGGEEETTRQDLSLL